MRQALRVIVALVVITGAFLISPSGCAFIKGINQEGNKLNAAAGK